MADRSVHRVIHAGDKGPDVKRLQEGLNKIVDHYEFDWRRIKVDGENGDLTKRVARLAGFAIGLSKPQLKNLGKGTFTQHAQTYLRGDKPRTAQMEKAAKGRKETLQTLRQEHRKAVEDAGPSTGTVIFDGKACAAWIANDVLTPARASGDWTGYLISGFRTPAYSESLCIAMCGSPTCPGVCGGRYSNHACPPSGTCQVGEGAADVTDPAGLQRWCRAHGDPLHGNGEMLPADTPHFSKSGR